MIRRFIAPALMTAAAAASIAAAPIAVAAPIAGLDGGGTTTTTTRDGHVAIQAQPPSVSEPRSYGEFPNAIPFLGE